MILLKSTHITTSIKRDLCLKRFLQPYVTLYVLVLLSFLGDVHAQTTGTRSASLAGQTSTLMDNPWAVFSNPAGMSSDAWIALSVHRNFGLKELNEAGISFGIPVKTNFVYSLGTSTFGWERMRFWQINQGFRFKRDRLKLGVVQQLDGILLPNPYQSDWALQLNGGAQYELVEELSFGVQVNNLGLAKWRHSRDPILQQLSAGLSWRVHSTIDLHVQLGMSDHYETDHSLALEWNPLDELIVGFGLGTHPARISFGFNIQRGKNQFGWTASNYHRISKGWTQAAEIGVYR